MSENILVLVPPTGPIDDTLVPTLERLIEAVKSGEVACIAYAAVLRDGSIQTAVSPPASHVFSMLGAIERLKLRYYALHVEEPES